MISQALEIEKPFPPKSTSMVSRHCMYVLGSAISGSQGVRPSKEFPPSRTESGFMRPLLGPEIAVLGR
jgi:hypothetical protein